MIRKKKITRKHPVVSMVPLVLVLIAAFAAGRTFVSAQEWKGPQNKPPINNTGQPPGVRSFTGYLDRTQTALQTLQTQIIVAKTSAVSATLGGANGNIGILGKFSFTTPAYYPTGRIGVYGYATGSPHGLYAFGDGTGVSYGVFGVGESSAEAGRFYGPVSVLDNGLAQGTFWVENGAVVAQKGIRCLEASGCIVPASPPQAEAIFGTHTAGGFGVYGYSGNTFGVAATTDDLVAENAETATAFSTSGPGAGGYGATGGVYAATGPGDQAKTHTGAIGYAITTPVPGPDSFQARKGAYGLSEGGLGNKSSYGVSFPTYDLAAGVRACVKDASGTVQNKIGISGTGGRFSGYFDGTLSCSNTPTWTLDTVGETGKSIAIAVSPVDSLPVIVYWRDGTTRQLRVVKCKTTDCSAGNIWGPFVVSTAGAGFVDSVDVSVGADNLPFIVYRESSLRSAKCNDYKCDSAAGYVINTGLTLSFAGNTFASVAVRSGNLPIISYYNPVAADLRVISCGNTNCNSGNVDTLLVSSGTIGLYTSLAIGSDTFPVISYNNATAGTLEVAHCANANCTSLSASSPKTSIDSGSAGLWNSIAIDKDNVPVVSYIRNPGASGDLKFLRCGNFDCCATTGCSNTIKADIDGSVNGINRPTSIAVGFDGYPIIGYYDLTDTAFYVAKCSDRNCGGTITRTTIDSGTGGSCQFCSGGANGGSMCTSAADCPGGTCTSVSYTGNAGNFSDILISGDGLPVAAYQDNSHWACTSDLRTAKCYTDNCTQACFPQKSGNGGNVMIAGSGSLRMGATVLTLKNLKCLLNKAGYTQYTCP